MKTIIRGSVLALAAVILVSLIVGAGSVPPEAVPAAEGRQFAVMKIIDPEIVGPYTYPGAPPGAIKVIDLQLGITASDNSGDPNDPLSVKPQFSEITITKEFDKSSPDLNYYCALGQHFGSVTLYMIPAGGTSPPPYYLIILQDAVITKEESRMVYRTSDSKYAHLEVVSFKCGSITWQDITSGNIRSWDLVHNEVPGQ